MPYIILFILLFSFEAQAGQKIVGGTIPHEEHPGTYNTVALIKAENNKVFCTGSLISRRLILTAKHCLIDKEVEDVLVFFGADTNNPNSGVIVKPIRMKVRHPKDWEMTFPSFDVAWLELSEDTPESYRPLPILSDRNELPKSDLVHLVGHGNSSIQDGKIKAGEKLTTTTHLKKYYDNARFFHILLFEGPSGQGACHGDSGGPAYVRTKNGWAIIGVTNGFDVVLTPKAMKRTEDEDFPYRIDCKVNQNLYSFAGAHGKWIEETSKIEVLKTSSFSERDRTETASNNSLKEWCQRRDIGSPRWNLLKIILDQKADTMPQDEIEAFYNNCDEIEDYLSGIKNVYINGEKTMEASYSFAPLHLLSIESLKVFDIDASHFSFKSEYAISIEKIQFNRTMLKNLKLFEEADLDVLKLDLSFNPLTSMKGLTQFKSLKHLDLSSTQIIDFSLINSFSKLEYLDLTDTSLYSTELINLPQLKGLRVGSKNLKSVDLSNMVNLESFSLMSMKIDNLNFLASTQSIRELNLPGTGISDFSIFKLVNFDNLEKINLTGNPVTSLDGLQYLSSLTKLRLFGTPLGRGEIQRTPENCPLNGAEVLSKFCLIP